MKNFFILIIFIIFLIFIIVRDYQIKKKKLKLNNALNSNFFIQTINKLIDENKYNLLEERIRLRDTVTRTIKNGLATHLLMKKPLKKIYLMDLSDLKKEYHTSGKK